MAKTVGKRTLFDLLRDSPLTTKVNDDEFTYEWAESQEKEQTSGPRWTLLHGVEIELPPGFDASGAETGYFAPTNQDNHPGKPKKKYLTDNPISRPIFRRKNRKEDDTPRVGRPPRNATPNEKGGPSDHVFRNLPEDFNEHRLLSSLHFQKVLRKPNLEAD